MKTNNLIYIFAGIITVGFFALLYLLAVKEVPENNADVINLVVGALIAAFSSVVSYFFGSSAGSKQKTELLANQNKE